MYVCRAARTLYSRAVPRATTELRFCTAAPDSSSMPHGSHNASNPLARPLLERILRDTLLIRVAPATHSGNLINTQEPPAAFVVVHLWNQPADAPEHFWPRTSVNTLRRWDLLQRLLAIQRRADLRVVHSTTARMPASRGCKDSRSTAHCNCSSRVKSLVGVLVTRWHAFTATCCYLHGAQHSCIAEHGTKKTDMKLRKKLRVSLTLESCKQQWPRLSDVNIP